MTERITITKEYDNGTIILTLDATRMTETYTKIMKPTPYPKSTNNQPQDTSDRSFGPAGTKITDLLRVIQGYQIDGVIAVGDYGTDTHSAVLDRKNDLRNMYLSGGNFTFTYDDRTGISGTIDKLEIEKVFTDTVVADFNDGEEGYRFKLNIIEGVVRGF